MSTLRGLSVSLLLACCPLLIGLSPASAQGADNAGKSDEQPPAESEVAAGHSYHGEAFNEGPRQQAVLMGGTGHVDFPVTTSSEQAQQFVTQGLGQVYGFWYLEAERSFRQAASLDPQCAMAYWGAALANKNNTKRAKGFMEEAMKLRDKVSEREQKYLDALNKYVNADPKKKKERGENYVRDLEKLLYEHPEDVEAKAMLALQLYLNRSSGSKIDSYLAVDALMQQVFAVQPLHSAHHFRIHLWDYERPQTALSSAALCGEGSPSIAHMWHMPGHIYSRLKRYNEAAWQQEASARTDHAHMIRYRVMPDEIHNFAHNNEWLIRNLVFVGRARDALDLAKNMLELPRHPRYNTLTKRGGSASYGRRRLLQVLQKYELWDEAIALASSPYLEPGSSVKMKAERMALLGEACFRSGKSELGDKVLAQFAEELRKRRAEGGKLGAEARRKFYRDKARQWAVDDEKGHPLPPWEQAPQPLSDPLKKQLDKAVSAARKAVDADIRELEKADSLIRGWKLLAASRRQQDAAQRQEHAKQALPLLRKGGADAESQARAQFAAGEQDKALEAIEQHVGRHENEVLPLACYVELLGQADKQDELKTQFQRLRKVAARLDLDVPVAERLGEVAAALEAPGDWREPFEPGEDFGQRPPLDTLGPFRWRPSPAPAWTLPGADGQSRSLAEFKGRPVLAIFYLGYGCLHCAEQLQKFAPMKSAFQAAGIDMIAVSTDTVEDLGFSIENYKPGRLPIPLVADPELDVFQAYRAHDDFEKQPLHGTFLIDGDGLVRWQDISYEPFMDADFLLKESKRLLDLTPAGAGEVSAQ